MAATDVSIGRIVAAMALFFVIGAPIVLFDWWTLDQVLAGHFPVIPMIVATILLGVFIAAAALLGRRIRRATVNI